MYYFHVQSHKCSLYGYSKHHLQSLQRLHVTTFYLSLEHILLLGWYMTCTHKRFSHLKFCEGTVCIFVHFPSVTTVGPHNLLPLLIMIRVARH